MINRVAIAVGIVSILVSIPALAVGLVLMSSLPFQGLLLLGVGVAAMEGGVVLIRRARERSVLTVFSPVWRATVAVLAVAMGAFAFDAASRMSSDDERPGWLPWALYGITILCGWIGIRVAWQAISGSKGRESA